MRKQLSVIIGIAVLCSLAACDKKASQETISTEETTEAVIEETQADQANPWEKIELAPDAPVMAFNDGLLKTDAKVYVIDVTPSGYIVTVAGRSTEFAADTDYLNGDPSTLRGASLENAYMIKANGTKYIYAEISGMEGDRLISIFNIKEDEVSYVGELTDMGLPAPGTEAEPKSFDDIEMYSGFPDVYGSLSVGVDGLPDLNDSWYFESYKGTIVEDVDGKIVVDNAPTDDIVLEAGTKARVRSTDFETYIDFDAQIDDDIITVRVYPTNWFDPTDPEMAFYDHHICNVFDIHFFEVD